MTVIEFSGFWEAYWQWQLTQVDLYNAEKRWLVWGVLDSTVICGDSLKDCGVIGRSGLVTPNFQCPLLAKLYVWFKTEVHRLSASLPITGINYLTIGIGR